MFRSRLWGLTHREPVLWHHGHAVSERQAMMETRRVTQDDAGRRRYQKPILRRHVRLEQIAEGGPIRTTGRGEPKGGCFEATD
jgi:hypothetical protein